MVRKLSTPALVIALAGGMIAYGCTAAQVATAEATARSVGTSAVGVLTLAANNPALLDEAKTAVSLLATKVTTPDHVAQINLALAHVTAGNVAQAATIVTKVVNEIPAPGTVTQ